MRAIAYGTTAWAFDDPPPSLPNIIRENLLKSTVPSKLTLKADEYQSAWNEARDSAIKNLEAEVVKRKVSKRSYQSYCALSAMTTEITWSKKL